MHCYALFFQRVFGLVEPLFTTSGNDDGCPGAAKALRNFQPQTPRTAGHNDDLALKIKTDGTHRCLLCRIIFLNYATYRDISAMYNKICSLFALQTGT